MKIQKAKHLHIEREKKNPDDKGEYLAFEKHDGWFGYLDFPSCIIHSSQLREIPAVTELSNRIRANQPNVKGRLIFEIMIDGLEYNSFHILNGILNRKSEEAEGAYLRVHDFIPEWNIGIHTMTRYNFAEELVQRLGMPEVRMSPILGTGLIKDLEPLAEDIWTKGGEGLILKKLGVGYSPGSRVSSLMKIKEDCDADLLCIDVIEGEGEHRGLAGRLICRDASGRSHPIGMGTMSHARRKEIFIDKSLIVGKVVEIKAMKLLKDGTYREPRFYAVRYDKTEGEIN